MKIIWDEKKNQLNIDETIRIFSSRKAEKKEIKEYGGN
jgi:uncharacterized DUF497 family protein